MQCRYMNNTPNTPKPASVPPKPANKSNANRRKQLIINPEIQYGMLTYVGALILINVIAQFISMMMFFSQIATLAQANDSAFSDILHLMSDYKSLFFIYNLIPSVSISIIGFYFFNRFTNRIVGPIYNINNVIKSTNAGTNEKPQIRLRDGDYFTDFAKNLNVLLKDRVHPKDTSAQPPKE